MTSNDELERRNFEEWYQLNFPGIQSEPMTDLALAVKSAAWHGWFARSKQEVQ